MIYDGSLNLALGMGAGSKLWKNKTFNWSDLVTRLQDGRKTNETYKEFMAASKEDQAKIKDVGGYVGGYLRNGRRKLGNIANKQLITLDIDFAHIDFWGDFTLQFGNAAFIHGTHKHHASNPRYRLVMPLSREVSPDEYVAIARRIAGLLGIDLFDGTTFEINRLMFWPSTPKDVEYYSEFQDGPWLDADEILDSYVDWKDSSLWPTASKDFQKIKDASIKQEDPETKRGVIGAFCRTYSISEAIELFLSDAYSPTIEDRYTYVKGSTASGLIIYDDKYAYSHHGTDPCGGKLCNAFDLTRIHMFGHLDETIQTNGAKSKSFRAMEDFARSEEKVRKTIASETLTAAKYDFAVPLETDPDTESLDPLEEDTDWAAEMEVDRGGKFLASASNLNIIFANDPRLKGLFKQNKFDGKQYIFGNLPWRKVKGSEPVRDVDYSGVRNYIESVYGISGSLKIGDSLALEFEKQSFHPVTDYLKGLTWDGLKRVDTLLIEYFGVEDTIYTREAVRKMLVGAVARVFNPGVKFDLVLTLVGAQGTGKSTFLKKLGKSWFSDTFMTVHGKEALEQIQGSWIIEMAELAGLRKAEVEPIKHFISKQEDIFRPAYAHTSETYPRQCIFVATTNIDNFLRDPSGNRRFLPVDIRPKAIKKDLFSLDFDAEIDQIWAEVVVLFKAKEKLFLSPDAERLAKDEQINHSENDERRGLIEQYLDRLLPKNWTDMELYDRRTFLVCKETKGKIKREQTCIAEIWCECLGKEKADMSRYNTREINDIMRGLYDWVPGKSPRNFTLYGKQKYYSRKLM
jgi:predicted P-loop ATPase